MRPDKKWPITCDNCSTQAVIVGPSRPDAIADSRWRRVYGTGMATGEPREYCPRCKGNLR